MVEDAREVGPVTNGRCGELGSWGASIEALLIGAGLKGGLLLDNLLAWPVMDVRYNAMEEGSRVKKLTITKSGPIRAQGHTAH
jgi:hypothetical protein